MRVHLGKTNYMVIGNKSRHNDMAELTLQCDGTFIERVSKHRLLGIFIDENLSSIILSHTQRQNFGMIYLRLWENLLPYKVLKNKSSVLFKSSDPCFYQPFQYVFIVCFYVLILLCAAMQQIISLSDKFLRSA